MVHPALIITGAAVVIVALVLWAYTVNLKTAQHLRYLKDQAEALQRQVQHHHDRITLLQDDLSQLSMHAKVVELGLNRLEERETHNP